MKIPPHPGCPYKIRTNGRANPAPTGLKENRVFVQRRKNAFHCSICSAPAGRKNPFCRSVSGFCWTKNLFYARRGGVYPPAPKEPVQPFRRHPPRRILFPSCVAVNWTIRHAHWCPLPDLSRKPHKRAGWPRPYRFEGKSGVCATPEKCFSLRSFFGPGWHHHYKML